MYSLGNLHIRVFYKNEESGSSVFSQVKDYASQRWSELVNDVWSLMFIESRLIQANGKAEVNKIIAEEKWKLTPMQIETIYTLYEFGEVGINMVWKDPVRGWKKFFALKEALKRSTNEPHIITFSNGEYTVTSISAYKSSIANTPENINVWVVRWFFNLNKKGSLLWFPDTTWENIATYCAKREWKTNIIWWDQEIAVFLWTKYGEKVKKEERVYDGILKEFTGKIDDNDLKNLLTNSKLERTADGKIDIRKIIMRLNITNPSLVPKLLQEESDKLRNDGMKLLKRAREDQKTLSAIKDLKSLGIPDIPKYIESKAFASFTLDECIKYIPTIDEVLKKEGDPIRKKEIGKIKGILITTKEGYGKVKDGWALAIHTKESGKYIKQNPNTNLEGIIKNAESSEIRKKESFAWDTSISRAVIEQGKDILKDMNIDISNFEDIQKKYQELVEKEKNNGLTIEEERIKAQLYAQIQANIRAAQVVKNYEGLLTKEDIQQIFTDTNRFVSWNPKEEYDFDALERTAVMTDPESTPGERRFAWLKEGDSLSLESFIERRTGDEPIYGVPEISYSKIVKNSDGKYSIIWPLKAENLSRKELMEYVKTIRLYAEIGLSQFIPHIALISGELQRQGISTDLDGKSDTTEQQKILKPLYKMLFGKEIITSSLWDVKRAFGSTLGNPTNMRNSMQEILREKHHLIRENNWSIDWTVLKEWIRSSKETDPQDILLNI
jgi:regulator of replication initiation timing